MTLGAKIENRPPPPTSSSSPKVASKCTALSNGKSSTKIRLSRGPRHPNTRLHQGCVSAFRHRNGVQPRIKRSKGYSPLRVGLQRLRVGGGPFYHSYGDIRHSPVGVLVLHHKGEFARLLCGMSK